jgi:hypothetical protein
LLDTTTREKNSDENEPGEDAGDQNNGKDGCMFGISLMSSIDLLLVRDWQPLNSIFLVIIMSNRHIESEQ